MATGSPQFETTLWSAVLLAAREPQSSDGRRALARLCEIYWYPIYTFIRRRGFTPEDAQDLTQGFFEHLLSGDFLSRADRERGRFRNFVLGAVRHFISNERERNSAQRRGGGRETLSIDASLAENWLSAEPSALNDPTVAFDVSWSIALLNHAMSLIEEEQRLGGKSETFAVLKEYLQRAARPGENEQIAKRLGMTKGAVAAAVHRLNVRYGELVRKVVRDTVSSADMAEEELKFLQSTLAR